MPKEAKYLFPKRLKKNKPFATLKLISPSSGIIEVKNNNKMFSVGQWQPGWKRMNCSRSRMMMIENIIFYNNVP